jgi:uncharacterized delta-60 repeat protein
MIEPTSGKLPFLLTLLLHAGLLMGQPGTLDPTFGTDGITITAAVGNDDQVADLAVQQDDRIVVVGSTVTAGNYDIMVLRYTADGFPDATFGTGGRVQLSFGMGNDVAYAVALQADGKIVVGGSTAVGSVSRALLVRLLPDGSLDPDFGENGRVISAIGSSSHSSSVRCLMIQPDGKLLAGGRATNNSTNRIFFMVARYNPSGTNDVSFDQEGYTLVDVGLDNINDLGTCIGLLDDGRIMLGGYTLIDSNYRFALVRMLADGTQDYANFNLNGSYIADLGPSDDQAESMVLLPDGTTVLVGKGDSQFALLGVLQPWDKTIAVGRSIIDGMNAMALARYDAQGELDASFGTNGTVTTVIPPYTVGALYGVGLQSDGSIVVAGRVGNSSVASNVLLARYRNDFTTSAPAVPAFNDEWHVFPNPFEDRIAANGTSAGGQLMLSDAAGRVIMRIASTDGSTTMPTPELPAGAYILTYYNGERWHQVGVVHP